jgi:phage protein U
MLYRGSFPNLKGGESSLVYFREIAKRREHHFIEEFSAQSDKQYGMICSLRCGGIQKY